MPCVRLGPFPLLTAALLLLVMVTLRPDGAEERRAQNILSGRPLWREDPTRRATQTKLNALKSTLLGLVGWAGARVGILDTSNTASTRWGWGP